MFNSEDFNDYPALKTIVLEISKFLDKEKIAKVSKLIETLESLLKNEEFAVPITYIWSVIAENKIELINNKLIQKIEPFIRSDNVKLKDNSIIILGFFVLANPDDVEKYFPIFVNLLIEKSEDVRDNGYFFLQEFIKLRPDLILSYKNLVLKALSLEIEQNEQENIVSILNFLDFCDKLNFRQLYKLRELLKSLITSFHSYNKPDIASKVQVLVKKFFPSLKEINVENIKSVDLIKRLDDQFLMEKINFSELSKKKNIGLKEFLTNFKRSKLKDKEIYFYIKNKEKNIVYFFELEKDKLIKFFTKSNKLTQEQIMQTFSKILESKAELRLFVKALIRLGHINGYFSELRYYYPYEYLKSVIKENLQKEGAIDLEDYDYLPPGMVEELVSEVANDTKQGYLLGKNKNIYYSLKKIQEQINQTAAKNNSVDLQSYREQLLDEYFIKLIKNLPKGYLTEFHKGTHWLTNLGKIRIEKELENSKIIGFYDIQQISKKMNVNKILLMDIIDFYVDTRSGIFNKNKEVFYFSKFLKDKINAINQISDKDEKAKQVNLMALELNIEKNQILSKIDENLRSIGDEIKQKDQIKISDYLEKTGMELGVFFSFIAELEIPYLKKGDVLILNPRKIEEAKKDIKSNMMERSNSEDYISLGNNFEINLDLVGELIRELQKEKNLKGIFFNEEGELKFYTEKGIRDLMLENSFIFSFYDLFYGKELSKEEIEILKEIFEKLIKEKRLKGSFDEASLTFSSDEVTFANNYNIAFDIFEKMVNNYIQIFDLEFQKIKKILTKREETIFPQEIKLIQSIIDRINEKYISWRASLEAYVEKANVKLLKQQGYNIKKYKDLSFSPEKRSEIKSFAEDPEVNDILKNFNAWIKLFNELEIKYANVIFYQKRLINNLEDNESKQKLEELMINLNLI